MWSKSIRSLSEIKQSPAELLIILRIFARVMSHCDLGLWPLDLELLQHFGYHAFKLCTKFEWNRVIHRWVIGDLARFCSAILGAGHDWQTVLRGSWTKLHKLSEDIGRSFLHKKFVWEFWYLAAFSNAGGSKLSDVENDTKFRTFWPPLWKLGELLARYPQDILQF